MRDDCPTCERKFAPEDIHECEGLKFIFGIGIEYEDKMLHLKPSEHKILRLLMTRRYVTFGKLTDEICRPSTTNPRGSIKVQMHALRGALKIVGAPLEIVHFREGYTLVRHVAQSPVVGH